MKQVLVIHGGNSYSSRQKYLQELKAAELKYERLLYSPSWKLWLIDEMPDADILLPHMPNRDNAVYDEWVIWFEKILPFLEDDVRLVGHSLGAMFLAKYLQTNRFDNPVAQLHLVAGGYDDNSNEDCGSFLIESATNVAKSANETHLWHSQDDPIVAFHELAKFESDLPQARSHVFTDRGHFWQATFPELLDVLKQK
ncbi:alpha/beta hydrolase [Candidatus Saccharibacteria bacterium]|nr:alpha/beta hydrolase [Candidatus Saccharibacteria bacterium]